MKAKIILTIVYLVLLVVLLSLSHWQWRRAEQKQQWLQQREVALQAEPVDLSAIGAKYQESLCYRKTKLNGYYDTDHQFLLDNQISEGKAGYYVLTPLKLINSNKAVLVNRGWIPLPVNRIELPILPATNLRINAEGRINDFPTVAIKLKDAEIPTANWPSIVQLVDVTVLSKKLGYPLLDFQVELDEHEPDGFKRTWQIATVMQPEQHIGYALQWLALALTLTALYIGYGFIKKHND